MREQQVRDASESRPWQSFAISFAIYSLVSLVPGTSGKSVVFSVL